MDPRAIPALPARGSLVGGRYRMGEVLGEGGMGVVLAAHDEREDREVALKLLRFTGGTNATSTERFLREARVAERIESEHVAQVLELGVFEGCPFFAMERLRGTDFG